MYIFQPNNYSRLTNYQKTHTQACFNVNSNVVPFLTSLLYVSLCKYEHYRCYQQAYLLTAATDGYLGIIQQIDSTQVSHYLKQMI